MEKIVTPLATWISNEDELNEIRFKREVVVIEYSSYLKLVKSFSKKISNFVEIWILFRISLFGYWNNVNMNLRFIGLLTYSAIICFLISLFKNDKLFLVTSFGAIFGSFFWQDRSSYYQKWKYLADLYNDVLKASPQIDSTASSQLGYYSYRKSLNIALAVDIVQMEMWSHTSYKDIVVVELKDAMKDSGIKIKTNSEFFYETSKITKDQAVKTLVDYQRKILERENFQFRSHLANKYLPKKVVNS